MYTVLHLLQTSFGSGIYSSAYILGNYFNKKKTKLELCFENLMS